MEPQDPGTPRHIPDLDWSDVYADAARMREEVMSVHPLIDAVADYGEGTYRPEDVDRLNDDDLLNIIDELSSVAESLRRLSSLHPPLGMSGETRDALCDGIATILNVDW